jgi:hypothetical protein
MLNTPENQAPTVEEMYDSATHASNLRVVADRNGPGDLLIIMGWSQNYVGAALMRLQSEWNGAAHPMRMTSDQIKLMATTYRRDDDGLVTTTEGLHLLPLEVAKRDAKNWYMHEVKILFGKLKSLPLARDHLARWARLQMIDNADHRVAEILHWHLDHKCPACEGRGKELIPNTPILSHKDCKVCRGTKETRIPHQQGNEQYLHESKKMLRYINDCIKTEKTRLKQTLPNLRRVKRFAEGR